jgi:hypothetical protein
VRHLRAVHQLARSPGSSPKVNRHAEHAERTHKLEQPIARSDIVDYRLVLIGSIGLALSFVIGFAWMLWEK